MKFIKQFGIILAISFIGEIMNYRFLSRFRQVSTVLF